MTASDEGIAKALDSISDQLRTLVRLVAASQIQDFNQKDTVEHLGRLGLDARTISEISGYPITSVAPALSRLKASRRPRRSGRPAVTQETPNE